MRPTTTRCIRQLLSSAPARPITQQAITHPAQRHRPITTGPPLKADRRTTEAQLSDVFAHTRQKREQAPSPPSLLGDSPNATANPTTLMPYTGAPGLGPASPAAAAEPHHFHIYSHKHNTHITLTSPARDPLISVSCGNMGFRKHNRKHYDSAFQLAQYVLGQMKERGLLAAIADVEVVLRGFGAGREAVTKALLGAEGVEMRRKIRKVADNTRLKFGGTRSKRPRRL